MVTQARHRYGVDRMAISGGEATLNRPWLVQFIGELKRLNPDPQARFHVQTNGSLLTHEYVDELVNAGMTDIGVDLKGLETETFMRVTGVKDRRLAERYRDNAWEAVRYLAANHGGRVFMGIGIPYNAQLIPPGEVVRIGEKVRDINPRLQVGVLVVIGPLLLIA